MTSTALEESVLQLPKPDRAHLVSLLLDSLDETSNTDVQQLWLNEAQRRADDIDRGQVELVSGEKLAQQVEALFR